MEVELWMDDKHLLKTHYGKETAIAINSHRYAIDSPLGWVAGEFLGVSGNLKSLYKRELAYIPILGWFWQLQEQIFVNRNWKKDQKSLAKSIKGLMTNMPYPITITIAPEGTRFTPEKHAESMKVARNKGIPELKHHLLPRTKGFVTFRQLMNQYGKIEAVYDFSFILSETNKDGSRVNILSLFQGKAPKCKILFRRFPIDQIPLESEPCSKWVYDLFYDKDEIIDEYARKGTVSAKFPDKVKCERKLSVLINWLCWAAVILGALSYWLVKNLSFGNLFSFIIPLFISGKLL